MTVPDGLDHLVYATPDLDRTVREIGDTFGVAPLPGGVHPAWGTRNALLPLGPDRYLEIIGPDPERPDGLHPTIFRLGDLRAARLVTWAARGRDLPALVARAHAAGVAIGAAAPGSRRRADGTLLRWVLTDPLVVLADGLVPFFIDWGPSPHPGSVAPAQVRLLRLTAEHPQPQRVRQALKALGLELEVTRGADPALRATFESPRGVVALG